MAATKSSLPYDFHKKALQNTWRKSCGIFIRQHMNNEYYMHSSLSHKYQWSDVTPVSSLIQPRTSTTQMKTLSFCTVYVTDQAVQHYYGLQSVLVNCKKLSQIQLNTVLANVWASWIQHGMNWRSHHVSCSMQQRPNDLTSTLPLLTDTWTGSV